jgi:hypothetical protein
VSPTIGQGASAQDGAKVPPELLALPPGLGGQARLFWWLVWPTDSPFPTHKLLSDVARSTLLRDAGWTRRQFGGWILTRVRRWLVNIPATLPVPFAFITLAMALLPLSFIPDLWKSDDDASAFLSVLWQVMAGTLGIVVAAVLFLYEAYGSTIKGTYGISVAEYSAESGVTRLVGWLTSSLVLTGAVLLGWGDHSPRGWSGLLALLVAGRAVLALPGAFLAVANLVGTKKIQDLRKKFLRRRVAEAVRADLLQMRMIQDLETYLISAGLQPAFSLEKSQATTIVADRAGRVIDVNLRRLNAKLPLLGRDEILLPLFYRVQAGTPLGTAPKSAWAPITADFLVTAAAGRVGRPNEFEYLKELHLDSLRAVREQDGGQVEANLELYEELVGVMLDFEERLVAHDLMSPAKDTDLIVTITRHMYLQFKEAITIRNLPAARAIAWAPIAIMSNARDAGNVGIATEFLKLAGTMAESEMSAK